MRTLLGLAIVLVLAGCSGPAAPPATSTGASPGPAAAATSETIDWTGQLDVVACVPNPSDPASCISPAGTTNENTWTRTLTATLTHAALKFEWSPETPASQTLQVTLGCRQGECGTGKRFETVEGASPLIIDVADVLSDQANLVVTLSVPNYTDPAGRYSQVEDGTMVHMTGTLTYGPASP